MNLSEIKKLVREGVETAILNNEHSSKMIFFELLSKIEQLEQKQLLSSQNIVQSAVSEESRTRSYTKMENDVKNNGYIIANYLSLYGHEDLFPTFTQDKSFEEISRRLNIKKNTLKNWRDMLDWHNKNNSKKENSREGWKNCKLPQVMEEIKNKYGHKSKEEFLVEVKQILNIQ